MVVVGGGVAVWKENINLVSICGGGGVGVAMWKENIHFGIMCCPAGGDVAGNIII